MRRLRPNAWEASRYGAAGRAPHRYVRPGAAEWERALGAFALLAGATVLLVELPLVLVAPLVGIVFLTCALLCAVDLVPGRATLGLVAGGIAAALFLPLLGLPPDATLPYRLLAGTLLGAFGIVKLT